MNMTMAEVCRKAVRIMRSDGWCKKAFVDENGRKCLIAAVNVARGADPHDELPLEYRERIYCSLKHKSTCHDGGRTCTMGLALEDRDVWKINDKPETTWHDIRQALERIAERDEMIELELAINGVFDGMIIDTTIGGAELIHDGGGSEGHYELMLA